MLKRNPPRHLMPRQPGSISLRNTGNTQGEVSRDPAGLEEISKEVLQKAALSVDEIRDRSSIYLRKWNVRKRSA